MEMDYPLANRQSRNWNLRLVTVPLGGVLLVAAAGIWGYASLREALTDSLRARLESDIAVQSSLARSWAESNLMFTMSLATGGSAQRLGTSLIAAAAAGASAKDLIRSPEMRKLREELGPPILSHNEVDFSIMNRQGRIVAALVDDAIGITPAKELLAAHAIALQGKSVFSEPFLSTIALPDENGVTLRHRANMLSVVPLMDNAGHIIGSFGLRFLPETVFASVTGQQIADAPKEVFLFDRRAMIASRSPHLQLMRDSGLVDERAASAGLAIQLRDPGAKLIGRNSPRRQLAKLPPTTLAAAAMASPEGLVLSDYSNYRGERVVGAWKWVPELHLCLGVELTANSAFQPLKQMGRTLALILGLLTIMCGFVAVFNRREQLQSAHLQDREEYLRAVVNTAAEGMFTVTGDGILKSGNAALERLSGYPMTELSGHGIERILPNLRLTETNTAPQELELLRNDGVPLTVQVSLGLFQQGNQLGFTGTVLDITRRKKAEMDLRAAHDELEKRVEARTLDLVNLNVSLENEVTERRRAEQLKDELVSTVSHELRTPLASLRGFAELMLQREFSPQRQKQFLTVIHKEAIRLTNLINDFLDLQKMESGRFQYLIEPTDLAPLLQDAIGLFSAQSNKHRFELQVAPRLPQALADGDRFKQVLSNLVSNAVKYSPHGGTVTVGARHESESIVIWVADQGIGIPKEVLPKLFSKFFRVDNADTRSVGGTGLGLALVKKIVEAHHGQVWLESEFGIGSTFFIRIPCVETGEPAAGDACELIDVLLVEDDFAYSALLTEYMESKNWRVRQVNSAELALQILNGVRPRFILLDIHLAGKLTGWDLLLQLRHSPLFRSIPVLCISANEASSRNVVLEGASYVTKETMNETLPPLLQSYLNGSTRPTVLMVEDQAISRLQMVRIVRQLYPDVHILEAGNGREALNRLAQATPNLMLIDLMMPEMDGFELLRNLRADSRLAALPGIVVTSKDLLPGEKAAICNAMAPLLRKDQNPPQKIIQTIEERLGLCCC